MNQTHESLNKKAVCSDDKCCEGNTCTAISKKPVDDCCGSDECCGTGTVKASTTDHSSHKCEKECEAACGTDCSGGECCEKCPS